MGIGLYGTGIMTSTGRYPNIHLQRVTAGMSCGTIWANQIQTAIYMIQKDAYNVRSPGFSTFASYVFNVMNVTGSAKYPSHSQLANVTASQHHYKLHAGDHIGDSRVWRTDVAIRLGNYAYPFAPFLFTQGAIYLIMGRSIYRSGDYGKNWQNILTWPAAATSPY